MELSRGNSSICNPFLKQAEQQQAPDVGCSPKMQKMGNAANDAGWGWGGHNLQCRGPRDAFYPPPLHAYLQERFRLLPVAGSQPTFSLPFPSSPSSPGTALNYLQNLIRRLTSTLWYVYVICVKFYVKGCIEYKSEMMVIYLGKHLAFRWIITITSVN